MTTRSGRSPDSCRNAQLEGRAQSSTLRRICERTGCAASSEGPGAATTIGRSGAHRRTGDDGPQEQEVCQAVAQPPAARRHRGDEAPVQLLHDLPHGFVRGLRNGRECIRRGGPLHDAQPLDLQLAEASAQEFRERERGSRMPHGYAAERHCLRDFRGVDGSKEERPGPEARNGFRDVTRAFAEDDHRCGGLVTDGLPREPGCFTLRVVR